MSIRLAILGILSWKLSTGYELKKIFEDSSFMYWFGNNNQKFINYGIKAAIIVPQETIQKEDLKKWLLK